jgi:hypothetical protein
MLDTIRRPILVALSLAVFLLPACADKAPTTQVGSGSESTDLPTDGGIGDNPAAYDNMIAGDKVDSQADAQLTVSIVVLEPTSLGDPVGIFVSDKAVPSGERVVEFDFDTNLYGRVVVEEAPPEVPPGEWKAYLDLLVGENDNPQMHGQASVVEVRGGKLALITTTEDGSRSDIRWLENDALEIYVRGYTLKEADVMALAEDTKFTEAA